MYVFLFPLYFQSPYDVARTHKVCLVSLRHLPVLCGVHPCHEQGPHVSGEIEILCLPHMMTMTVDRVITVTVDGVMVLELGPPKGGRGFLMSLPCLGSQGCQFDPTFLYLLFPSSA